MLVSISRAVSVISSSLLVTPRAFIRAKALAFRCFARGETRHRISKNVAARLAEPIHRFGRDNQRVRRVETARNADDGASRSSLPESLLKRAHLNVIGLVAILRQDAPGRPGQTENARHCAPVRHRPRAVKDEIGSAGNLPARRRHSGDYRRTCPAAGVPAR